MHGRSANISSSPLLSRHKTLRRLLRHDTILDMTGFNSVTMTAPIILFYTRASIVSNGHRQRHRDTLPTNWFGRHVFASYEEIILRFIFSMTCYSSTLTRYYAVNITAAGRHIIENRAVHNESIAARPYYQRCGHTAYCRWLRTPGNTGIPRNTTKGWLRFVCSASSYR